MTDATMQHRPHVGRAYEQGIDGKKVAVMGYSHWSDDPDREDFTEDCLVKVMSGEWNDIAFFNQIAGYFGMPPAEFWDRVVFLNFLPRKVGGGDGRFGWGSEADTQEGRERAMTMLAEHKPDLLFVFSTKAWSSLPPTLEERDIGSAALVEQGFDRHHYRTADGHVVQAFGFRHPQGASKDVMTRGVAATLTMEPAPPN